MSSLSIESSLPEVVSILRDSNKLILVAPPGAGKTTRVPLCLLQEAAWLSGMKILMLEPRRLAARAAACRMSECLGEEVGLTVGYRTRLDTRVSKHTRIEVVTEGVLTRMLQQDPELRGIGCVVFDEFHERSLNADLGLTLCLDVQASLREELRILVMSATLDVERLEDVLQDAPVVSCQGQSYPVDIHYLGMAARNELVNKAVAAIQLALKSTGSILVFLPGESEIRQVERALAKVVTQEVLVMPLYGGLSREQQNEAIRPCRSGSRKLVLASSIAETSLTIEGVRIVVDSGWTRVAHFDHHVGMSRLQTIRVSQASAVQRCGRAGRVETGECYRLWTEEQNKGLVKFHPPEILSADLTSLALELAQWGVSSPDELSWIDAPPAISFSQSRDLLTQLGALNKQSRITAHGREMLALGLHPRLAHMLIEAKSLGLANMACDIAALLEERDIFRAKGKDIGADIQYRLMALRGEYEGKDLIDSSVLKRVKQASLKLRQKLAIKSGRYQLQECGLVLALAYPDRIGQKRFAREGQYLLSSGKGASIDVLDAMSREEYLVAASLGGQGSDPRIYLAAVIDKSDLLSTFSALIFQRKKSEWDQGKLAVLSKLETCLGSLVLQSQQLSEIADKAQAKSLLLSAVAKSKLEFLALNQENEQWIARVSLAGRMIRSDGVQAPRGEIWPQLSYDDLLKNLSQWLGPYLDGIYSIDALKRLDMQQILNGLLSWEQQSWLDEVFPREYQAPTGSRVKIDYITEDGPVLAVRMQEVFGLADTPTVAQGRLKLKLHLLSPARRPIQVTRDLAGFWQGAYAEVKKEMKGRYPKHFWPDDPLQAEATKFAKPRR